MLISYYYGETTVTYIVFQNSNQNGIAIEPLRG